ncbi:MAG: DUF4340 domain-containing protein [Treponema sp.]|jgi:hypothetical protein|nr:DUF4340 domain-containing protein [Treponema sp.]
MITYKNHVIFLLSLIGALVLAYIGSLIFNSGIGSTRASSYSWLDSRTAEKINKIAINVYGENTEINRKNNQWFVSNNGNEYLARQLRIEDFISILTTRSAWTIRSSNASTHERFGLDGSIRVTIYGENNFPLLDLFLGSEDAAGRETYFRKAGSNEVRSGDNRVKTYITSPITSWYNLRLIPESEGDNIDVKNVQRLSVYTEREVQVFTRRNRSWVISGISVENPDISSIESYIRQILTTEGDNFVDDVYFDDPMFNQTRIVLELDTGLVKTIRFNAPDESGRRYAHVSGNEYVYSIPSWSAARLFREAVTFEMQ